jgi:hypothetical protein
VRVFYPISNTPSQGIVEVINKFKSELIVRNASESVCGVGFEAKE